MNWPIYNPPCERHGWLVHPGEEAESCEVCGLIRPIGTTHPAPLSDPVSAPKHYTQFGDFDPVRVAVERYGRGILCAKIDKYTARAPMKNGAEDLAKAKRCLEMLTKFDGGDVDWWRAPA